MATTAWGTATEIFHLPGPVGAVASFMFGAIGVWQAYRPPDDQVRPAPKKK